MPTTCHADTQHLWRIARELLGLLWSALGVLSPRRVTLELLAPLETLLRHLLLVEAANFTRRVRRPLSSFERILRTLAVKRMREARIGRTRRFLFRFSAADDASALAPRVSIAGVWRNEKAAPWRTASPTTIRQRLSARIEAAASVLAAPLAHARRLAARLRRLGAAAHPFALQLARAAPPANAVSYARESGDARRLALLAAHAYNTS